MNAGGMSTKEKGGTGGYRVGGTSEARGEMRREAEQAAACRKAKRAEEEKRAEKAKRAEARKEEVTRTNRIDKAEAAATERGMCKAERDAIAKMATSRQEKKDSKHEVAPGDDAKDARRAVLKAKYAPLWGAVDLAVTVLIMLP